MNVAPSSSTLTVLEASTRKTPTQRWTAQTSATTPRFVCQRVDLSNRGVPVHRNRPMKAIPTGDAPHTQVAPDTGNPLRDS